MYNKCKIEVNKNSDGMYTKARAKINLTLNILNKRPDNYHNLESIFQKVNLYDELYIEKTHGETLELISNLENVKLEDNIIYKAYIMLKEQYKIINGIRVILNKKIPTEAGLAGGSTDCASFILAINKLYNLNMKEKELIDIGKKLGADVCPCYYNTAVKAEGIGEVITKINTMFKYYLLIIKPQISCSTKNMFNKIDKTSNLGEIQKSEPVIKALETNNIELLCNNLYNRFEDVVDEKNIISNLKTQLKNSGAIGTLMTGSGSCVFGIYQNKNQAKYAYEILKNKYDIYICTSYNKRGKI